VPSCKRSLPMQRYSIILGNTAGQTKKSVVTSAYSEDISALVLCTSSTVDLTDTGASVGNIVGPLLFNTSEKPTYQPGLRATLGFFVAFAVVIGRVSAVQTRNYLLTISAC
jgi:hypothetical protein